MNKTGCLIIHGFGGSLEDIKPLAAVLKENGYLISCPQLKGHTGKRKDLKGVKYQEWIDSAEEDLKTLLTSCEKVYLIGFSMGGLIAVNLACKYNIAGIVTLNTPIYYWDIPKILSNIYRGIVNRDLRKMKFYLKASLSFPLSALFNFRLLLAKTKPLIKNVKCPAFIGQALDDDTVRKSSAEFIYRHISTKKKTLKFYKNSGHLILWSKESLQVIQDVRGFLDQKTFLP